MACRAVRSAVFVPEYWLRVSMDQLVPTLLQSATVLTLHHQSSLLWASRHARSSQFDPLGECMSAPVKAKSMESLSVNPDDYRMLVLDLDGTALNYEGALEPKDIRAAAALRERGVIVTIATGRLYGGTAAHAKTLGVDTQIACMNGAEMLSSVDGSVSSAKYLPNEVAVFAREQLQKHSLATSLFSSWEIHHCATSDRYRHYLETWSTYFKEYDDVYKSPAWESDERLLAVVSTGPIQQIQDTAEALNEEIDQDLYEILAFPAWPRKEGDEEHGIFMLRDKRENKGRALRTMAKEAGIEEHQVVCVGDWMNDMPMLESEALSFAMNGTPDWLQNSAKYVTETHTKDGGVIAELAERVWGIK